MKIRGWPLVLHVRVSLSPDCPIFRRLRGKITLLAEWLEDFPNGEVALSTNVLVQGGVLWSKIVFCCFISNVCVCSETNAVTADVCAQNLFRVDVLGPCMAKVESVLMFSYCSFVSITVCFWNCCTSFPPKFWFCGSSTLCLVKNLGTHRALICRYERTKFTPNAGRLTYVLFCCLQCKVWWNLEAF